MESKMGFLKKERAPDELPDLALGNGSSGPSQDIQKKVVATIGPPVTQTPTQTKPEIINEKPEASSSIHKHNDNHIHEEDFLEFSENDHKKAKDTEEKKLDAVAKVEDDKRLNEELEKTRADLISQSSEDSSRPKFFDKILNDINGEIQDISNLENWYENKFESEDIVSNMKGYWEGNKADILIQSFGNEYKKKINEDIKELQRLEEDWRVIYFGLIKKEEEMKKVEQELKSNLSEFVDLCKRRKNGETKS